MSSQRSPPTRPSAWGLCSPKTGRETEDRGQRTEDRDRLLFRLLQLSWDRKDVGKKQSPPS